MSKKMVLKIEVHCEEDKKKAMKAVSTLPRILYLAMDMKEKKLTVHGEVDVDPVRVANKVRKHCPAKLLSVGPLKEAENKKGDDEKKDGAKKDDNKESAKMAELLKQNYIIYMNQNYPYCYPRPQYDYRAKENPNSCVIC